MTLFLHSVATSPLLVPLEIVKWIHLNRKLFVFSYHIIILYSQSPTPNFNNYLAHHIYLWRRKFLSNGTIFFEEQKITDKICKWWCQFRILFLKFFKVQDEFIKCNLTRIVSIYHSFNTILRYNYYYEYYFKFCAHISQEIEVI